MDENEKFVKEAWPTASCFRTKLFWPGQGERVAWIVIKGDGSSAVEGEGQTEEDAWKHAAEKIKRRI